MGKRSRVRRQSIRELPLIVGPLPLPESRLFADDDLAAETDSSSVRAAEGSLPVALDGADEGTKETVVAPGGEPLPR